METPPQPSGENQQNSLQAPTSEPAQSPEELLRSLQQQLAQQNIKMDAVYKSSERMRKYFMWTLIITVVTIVLPLIGLVFLVPYYLSLMQLPAGL